MRRIKMDIEIKHAGTSEMPYIYLAELRLCEDHINHGIDENEYGCRMRNIGTFADDIKTYYHIATKLVSKVNIYTGHNTLKALIADYNVVCQKFATGIGFKKIKDSNIYGMGEYRCEVNRTMGQ